MKKVELLAPAGNMESLIAAVQGGCDAVYMGLTTFSARAFAGNFSHEEYLEAIQYCHLRGVKVYVTLNTLLNEFEIENIISEVRFLYEHDVDAILVQDLGLFHILHTQFSNLDIHCSTQMNIHNIDGARFMQQCGASRIVLAREVPIETIQAISQLGIETEVFVYGALCVAYSGQCLMSSATKHRSGNKGMCAQLCRMKYLSNDTDNYGSYLLSPKDLNLIAEIPTLIEAGVASLKIEGRMKRKEYVYLVTKTFREAIDAYYQDKTYHVSKERMEDLKSLFNRGFTKGHIFHDSIANRMSQYRPNHQGIQIGEVLQYQDNRVQVKLSKSLYQNDGLRILNEPVDTGLTAVRIEKNGKLVREAKAGDIVWLDCKALPHPKKGQPLQRTTDQVLMQTIAQDIQNSRSSAIAIHYICMEDQPLSITIFDNQDTIVYKTDYSAQKALNAPLTKERIEETLRKVDTYPFTITSIHGTIGNAFLPIAQLNEARRKAYEVYAKKKSLWHTNRLEKPYTYTFTKRESTFARLLVEYHYNQEELIGIDASKAKYSYQKLPTIQKNEYNKERIQNTVVFELGGFMVPSQHTLGGWNLNIANSYALAFLYENTQIEGCILSTELEDAMVAETIQRFYKRYGFTPNVYQLVYGKRTLMYIQDGFGESINTHELIDLHNHHFPIYHNHSVTEILEEEAFHAQNQNSYGSYVILTDENESEQANIVEEAYEEIYHRI